MKATTRDIIARAVAAGRQDIADWLRADDAAAEEAERRKREAPVEIKGVGTVTPDGRTVYNLTVEARGRRRELRRVTVTRKWGWLRAVYPSGAARTIYPDDKIVAVEIVG